MFVSKHTGLHTLQDISIEGNMLYNERLFRMLDHNILSPYTIAVFTLAFWQNKWFDR